MGEKWQCLVVMPNLFKTYTSTGVQLLRMYDLKVRYSPRAGPCDHASAVEISPTMTRFCCLCTAQGSIHARETKEPGGGEPEKRKDPEAEWKERQREAAKAKAANARAADARATEAKDRTSEPTVLAPALAAPPTA